MAYALQSIGATPGVLQPKKTNPNLSGSIQVPPLNLNQTPKLNLGGQPQQGTNQGLLNSQSSPYGEKTKETLVKDVQGNSYQAPKPNPSVLEQQKALNKLGAGLVEDGITGPKTREAIAKYGNTATTPKTETKPATPPPTPPAPLTVKGQVPGLLQSGQQTQNETDTQARLRELSNAPSEAYVKADNDYKMAVQALADFDKEVAEKKANINLDPIPLEFQQGRQQVLTQKVAETRSALQNAVNQQQQAMTLANTQQGLQTQAGQSAYAGAQTQAGRGLSAAGTALGAVAPITGVPFGTQTVQPGLLGEQQGGAGTSGILQGGAARLIPQYYDEYNQAQSVIDNISKNEELFSNLLSVAKVNPADLTPINEVLQRVGQLTSSADYANFQNLLSSLRANYAQLLASRGLTPTDAGVTANSLLPENASIATINSVLSTLKQEGQNYLSSKADQLKRAEETFNTGTAPDTSTPTTSGGGMWDW